jgi:hypothetical protein
MRLPTDNQQEKTMETTIAMMLEVLPYVMGAALLWSVIDELTDILRMPKNRGT